MISARFRTKAPQRLGRRRGGSCPGGSAAPRAASLTAPLDIHPPHPFLIHGWEPANVASWSPAAPASSARTSPSRCAAAIPTGSSSRSTTSSGRGSELNLPRLRAAGVRFVHGDVRAAGDLLALPRVDAIVECSAEPSALAGRRRRHRLRGAARTCSAPGTASSWPGATARSSSSSRRAASIPSRALDALALDETPTRFELADEQPLPGASARGIAETFPLEGARTLYGATKLAAELLVDGVPRRVRPARRRSTAAA